jgi:hypothetical protein
MHFYGSKVPVMHAHPNNARSTRNMIVLNYISSFLNDRKECRVNREKVIVSYTSDARR